MTDAAAAAAALEAGDIQALDDVSPSALPGIQENAGLHVLTGAGLGWNGIRFNIGNKNGVGNLPYTNVGTPIASSPLLRQAFEEAIDRSTMNRVVFGRLEQTSCTPIPPANTTWFAAIKVPCTPFDPADAKRLVARSGIANPTVTLLTGSTSDGIRLGEFIQAEENGRGDQRRARYVERRRQQFRSRERSMRSSQPTSRAPMASPTSSSRSSSRRQASGTTAATPIPASTMSSPTG